MNAKPWFQLPLIVLLVAQVVRADSAPSTVPPLVHPLFSDHMVLQRDRPVPVWGWTTQGTKVTVRLAKQSRTAVADFRGRWEVKLRPLQASAEPLTLRVVNHATGESVEIKDVVIGDVWLASGQSNMEMGVSACDATNDIAQADFPLIRLLTVPRKVAVEPQASTDCRWLPCTPQTVVQGVYGGFSAAAFFFGRELHADLKVPIGLIHSSWGGTIAEAWTSEAGLRPLHDFDDALDRQAAARRGTGQGRDYAEEFEAWCRKADLGTQQGWSSADLDVAAWLEARLPQPFEQAGVGDFDGIVWHRRDVELPATWARRDLLLHLGPIDDIDTTWFNGTRVGQMNRYDLPRVYRIPGTAVKAGRNVITVRVLDTAGPGGLTGQVGQLQLALAADPASSAISLAGSWRLRSSTPLSKLGAPPEPPDAGNPNVPTVLYNGMIAPLVPFAIRGAIWYQGESNAGRAEQYRRLLPALIHDWRLQFRAGEFPFYIVQLAAFMPTNAVPRDHEWAELREAQAFAAHKVPHCGLAVAIDVGDAADIHPKNKLEVGRRLARSALAGHYGRRIPGSGPQYASMRVVGNTLRLKFHYADGGLTARGGKLNGFAVASADRKFVWAEAVIQGDTVVVSSPQVPNPVAARYAWDVNPVCNLYSGAGLPAIPFRTDDWPLVTAGRR